MRAEQAFKWYFLQRSDRYHCCGNVGYSPLTVSVDSAEIVIGTEMRLRTIDSYIVNDHPLIARSYNSGYVVINDLRLFRSVFPRKYGDVIKMLQLFCYPIDISTDYSAAKIWRYKDFSNIGIQSLAEETVSFSQYLQRRVTNPLGAGAPAGITGGSVNAP